MTNMTKEQWNQAVTEGFAKLDATKGVTVDAPVMGEGNFHPYQMPLCNRVITKDLIRLFTTAIGDPNPLWTKHDYAGKTRFGDIVAPPLCEVMIAETAPTPPPVEVEGITCMNGGSKREYFGYIRPGDSFYAKDTFLGVTEKSDPNKPYRLFIQKSQRDIFNQNDVLIVRMTANILAMARYPEGGPGKTLDFSDKKMRRYTDEELAEIHAFYEDELAGKNRRGANTLYWEDVNEGDSLGRQIMGPYDLSDAVSFFGVTGYSQAFASKWQGLRSNVDGCRRDPDTNEYSVQPVWHFNNELARMYNVPFAPIFGTHVETGFTHLITNWMGDDGDLKCISSQIRRMAFLGDTLEVTGTVVRKYEENGQALVDLELKAEHYGIGGVSSTSQATVVLKRKG